MKRVLIFLLAFSCQAQGLPKDLYSAPHRLNHNKYSVVEFKDIVVLQGSLWDDLFHREIKKQIKFSDVSSITVDNNTVKEWHGSLLSVPGCVGTQLNYPQKEFYFEDRSIDGLTIRGTIGMEIRYRCMAFAYKDAQ